MKQAHLRDTPLSISGANQVMEELLSDHQRGAEISTHPTEPELGVRVLEA